MACEIRRSIYNLLDLSCEGLEQVKAAVEGNNLQQADKLLKEYYLNREYPALFFKDSEKQQLVAYAKENFHEDIEEVIKVADEVSKNIFVFRFPWDMEKTNIPFTFEKEIVWSHIPFKDEEWAFMLNRHRYWITLGQAYAITGNEEYGRVFCEQLEHWIDNNQRDGEGAPITWRSIEAGIRCENWIKAFQYFKHSSYFTKELFIKMLLVLYDHCEYLMSRYDNFREISNWGVLENHGLFEASVFLNVFKAAEGWQMESLRRLKNCVELQVHKDGIHWEQSPMYHNEVLHCFMDVVILAEKNNIQICDTIKTYAKKMAYADLYMAKPNHHQPMESDSDDTDVRDMLTEAAILFNDGVLKFGAFENIDFNSLWLFGLEGIEKLKNILSKIPEKLSMAFESSGNYVMRSSWSEDGKYLFFDCGPIGGGHGHCDMLHFDIHSFGRDLICDIGRYTYVEGEPFREYFKGCKGHNTTIVDGKDFIKCKGSWGYEKTAEPCGQKWISEEEFDYVEGSHKGYLDLKDPVLPTRRILFVKPHYWLVIDSFHCKEEHTFQQYFHFPTMEVLLKEGSNECSTCYKEGGNIKIIPQQGKSIVGKLGEGYFSSEYNLLEENKVLSYTVTSKGFTTLTNIMYPFKAEEEEEVKLEALQVYDNLNNLVSKETAEAIKIKLPNNEEHIIFICHNRRSTKDNGIYKSLFKVENISLSGEVVFVKRYNSNEKVIVVK